ncbi:putative Dihydroorotate dehydrogenase [Melia azedarach]|uniref:Dihydroorotate dehydrogenase n=1 Tax=Melia azedarach TaxID=155640 RepID=A0ACC1YXG1_MELAZ|nr:putative Dihydroorotate dehydrogenase [Melia azedarach]
MDLLLVGNLTNPPGCFHLSKLDQVQSTLQNFFLNTKEDLYLLQVDAKKLGDGLIYELVDGTNSFPHFYGPSRSFVPLPLDVITKAEKLSPSDGRFSCSFLN